MGKLNMKMLHKSRKVCPRCKKTKVLSKFGLRKMKPKDKVKVPQSYCIECRSVKKVSKK